MPTVITGAELGLANIRTQGAQGQSVLGQAGAGLYINTTTGNLVLQQQDQVLLGQGSNTGLIRTYNSLGNYTDDNGDNFRFAFNQRLLELSGTLNSTGSRIIRVGGDGSESTYVYDGALGLYVSDEGVGANDTLSYNSGNDEWTYTEGSSQQQEIYDWNSGEGRITGRLDTDGNITAYRYHANGFIDEITDASGQVMTVIYSGNNASSVTTDSNGVTQTLVRYRYDSQNRLQYVDIDLTPDDNSIADGVIYRTTYTYHDDSTLVASISQSDGSSTSFNYHPDGRIHTVTDGVGAITSYTYNADPVGDPDPITTNYALNSAGFITPGPIQGEDYYPVPSGSTWAQIATSLYDPGDVDAATLNGLIAELQNVLNTTDASNLTHIQRSLLPESLVVNNASTPDPISTDYDLIPLSGDDISYGESYYVVSAGATWASITSELYLTSDVAAIARLQTELGLSASSPLPTQILQSDLPETLEVPSSSSGITLQDMRGIEVLADGTIVRVTPDSWSQSGGSFDSVETLAANTDGWLEFTIANDYSTGKAVGFSDATQSIDGHANIDNQLWFFEDRVAVREGGQWMAAGGNYVAGDRFRIERVGGEINYYKNDSLFYTSARTSTEEWRVEGFFVEQNGAIRDVAISFGSDASNVTATYALQSELETVPLAYAVPAGTSWSALTNSLYGTSDSAAIARLQTELGLSASSPLPTQILQSDLPETLEVSSSSSGITLQDMRGIEVLADGTIVRVTPDSWSQSGGSFDSVETMAANTDGWLEFTIANDYSTGKAVGFSNAHHSIDGHANIPIQLWFFEDRVAVRELGQWMASGGNYVAGDRFRIERVGGEIGYYKNNTLFYTSSYTSTEEARVEGFFVEQNGAIRDVAISFGSDASNVTATYALQSELEAVPLAYAVPAGTSWSALTNSLYGTSDSAAIAQLQTELGLSASSPVPTQILQSDLTVSLVVDGTAPTVSHGLIADVFTGGHESAPYVQALDNNGLVSIEAENFHAHSGGDYWEASTLQGFSGNGAMVVPDDANTSSHVNVPVSTTPRLDYDVNFVETGTYYVWVRGSALGPNSDSIHIGLNGVFLDTSDRLSGFDYPDAGYQWSNRTMDGPLATFEVTSTGVQTLNAWIREDGFIFDKVVITRDSSYTPESEGEFGPTETLRGSENPYYEVPAGTSWSALTNSLYGTSDSAAVAQLQTELGLSASSPVPTQILQSDLAVSLVVGSTSGASTSYPLQPVLDSPVAYAVQADQTWADIAQVFYGTTVVADQLEALLGGVYNLADTPSILQEDMPSTLTVTNDGEPSIGSTTFNVQASVFVTPDPIIQPSYYEVGASNSWAAIARELYFLDDVDVADNPAIIEALQSALGMLGAPDPAVGYRILESDLPSLLAVTTEGEGSGLPASSETTVTDALGYQTTYRFDTEGRVDEVLSPTVNGARILTSYAYDSDDNVISMTDGNGNTTYYQYDNNGNRVLEQDAVGNTVSRTYSADNQLLSETRYLGVDGNVSNSVNEATNGLTSRFIYDAEQHLRFSVSAGGQVSEYRYSSDGNVNVTIAYTAASYTGTDFSEAALSAWASAQDLTQIQRTDTAYDFRGQISTVTTYEATTSTGVGITDGTESVTHFTYDQQGRLLNTTAPKGMATSTVGDFLTQYTYDGLGRLLSTIDALGNTTSNIYNDASQQIESTAANGLVSTRLFDDSGRLVSQSRAEGATPLGTTTFVYDDNGNLLTTRDPLGHETHRFTDSVGRLIAAVDAEGSLSQIRYDQNGNAVETVAYVTSLNSTQISALTASADGASVESVLAGIVNVIDDASQDRTSYSFYNEANQLIYSIEATDVVNDGAVTQYFYDGVGQLTDTIAYETSISTAALTENSTSASITPAINLLEDRHNRLFYDANGQLQGSLDAEGHLTENIYDTAGQLIEVIAYAEEVPAELRVNGNFAALKASINTNDVVNDQHSYVFYDGKGQVIASLDAENYLTENSYDQNGNVTERVRYAMQANAYTGSESIDQLRPAPNDNDQYTFTTYTELDQAATETQRADTTVTTVSEFEYDELGQLIRSTYALGTTEVRTTRARYDVQGRLVGELSGKGNALLDALSNPTQAEIDALWDDHGITHAYDLAGRRIHSTDSNANTTYFYYNDRNQLSHTINALGEVSEVSYNAFGQVEATRQYTARVNTTGLVGGEITSEVQVSLDAYRNNATDNITVTNYNLRGAISQMIDGENYTTDFTYNTFGERYTQAQGITSSSFTSTQFNYDRLGQNTLVTSDVGGSSERSVETAFDAFGRAHAIVDAKAVHTYFVYDRLGRTVQTTYAGNTDAAIQTNQTYDAFGRVLTQTDGNRQVTTYTYDDAARSLTITTPEGISTSTTRNRHGETVTIVDGENNTTRYVYDRDGNLTETIQALGTAEEISTSSEFDHANRVIESYDANGTRIHFDYDAANRVIARTVDPSGLNILNQYHYDGQGRTVYSVDANGVLTETQYDRRGQVSAAIVDPTTYPAEFTRPSDLGPALNIHTEYNYDGRGKTLSVTEGAGTTEARTTEYRYDTLGRRTQMIEDAVTGGLNITTTYSYDDNDNLISKTEAADTAEARTTRYQFDEHNRLIFMADALGQVTESIYDNNGNIIRSTQFSTALTASQLAGIDDGALIIGNVTVSDVTADRTTRNVYDDDNRLTYAVDALGHVTNYRYDDNNNINRILERNNPLSTNNLNALDSGTDITVLISGSIEDRTSRSVYDALNRQQFSVNALGYVTEFTYDDNGNRTAVLAYGQALTASQQVAVANGSLDLSSVYTSASPKQSTHYVYDAHNRQRFTINSLNYVSETRYDALGNSVRSIQYNNAIALPGTVSESNVITALVSQATNSLNRVINYQYDSLGRVTQETDAENNTKQLSYNQHGNLTSVTDGNGNTGYFYYRADDKLSYKIDPEGYLTAYTHDVLGQLRNEIHYGSPITQSYNTNTALETVASWRGTPQLGINQDQQTSYTYTDAGLVDTITYHSNTGVGTVSERNQYNAFGDLEYYTDKNNHTWTYQYNQLGQLAREISPLVDVVTAITSTGHTVSNQQLTTEFDYDAYGNQTHQTVAMGTLQEQETITHYDALNRIERIESPSLAVFNPVNGASTIQTPNTYRYYDAYGNVTQETDGANNSQFFYYDNANRLVASVNADEVLQEFEYDAVGNLTVERTYDTRLTGTLSRNTRPFPVVGDTYRELTYSFDGNNQMTSVETPEVVNFSVTDDGNSAYTNQTVVNQIQYDGNGNPVVTTDPRGNSVYHFFDGLGNQIVKVDELGFVTQFEYDLVGNVIRETRYASALTPSALNGVSENSNPFSIINAISGSDENRVKEKDYNALGYLVVERTLDVVYHNVNSTNGQLIERNGAVETTYNYDGNGNVTEVGRPEDGLTYFEYDALGRQDSIMGPEFTAYVNPTSNANSRNVVTTLFDALGNAVVQTEHAHTNADNRITRSIFNNAGFKIADIDANGHRIDYDLDVFGNILRSRETIVDVNGEYQAYQSYYEYDDLNRVVSEYKLENPGTADAVIHTSSDQRYNAHGEIEAKGRNNQFQEQYRYDSIGRLFWTNSENGAPKIYLHDANGNVTAEMMSITTDLSNITSVSQARALDPTSVQLTLNVYDNRNQLIHVFEPPMDYTSLTTSLTPQQETVINNSPDIITDGPAVDVGGLIRDTEILSSSTTSVPTFLPPDAVESTNVTSLPAANYTDISLTNNTYIEGGSTVSRTVEVLPGGDIRELFHYQHADGSENYLTRVTEVEQIDQVTISPLGINDITTDSVGFSAGTLMATYTRSGSGRRSTLSVPYIEGYGDGPVRVVAVYSDRTAIDQEFSSGTLNLDSSYFHRVRIYKAGILLADHYLNNYSSWHNSGQVSINLPTVLTVKGENSLVNSIRVRINEGEWIQLNKETYQGSPTEFMLRGISANTGDRYEYEAYDSADASGTLLNSARGILGVSSSHEKQQVRTETSTIQQTVYEVSADLEPGEIGVTDNINTTVRNGIVTYNSHPSATSGTPVATYLPVNMALGTFPEAQVRTEFASTVVTEGSITTTTRSWQLVDVTRIVTAAPNADPYRLHEQIITRTEIVTEVTVTDSGQEIYIDDDIFAVEETTTNSSNITTTTEVQSQTVDRYHQNIETNIISNISHNSSIVAANPVTVAFDGSVFSVTGVYSQAQRAEIRIDNGSWQALSSRTLNAGEITFSGAINAGGADYQVRVYDASNTLLHRFEGVVDFVRENDSKTFTLGRVRTQTGVGDSNVPIYGYHMSLTVTGDISDDEEPFRVNLKNNYTGLDRINFYVTSPGVYNIGSYSDGQMYVRIYQGSQLITEGYHRRDNVVTSVNKNVFAIPDTLDIVDVGRNMATAQIRFNGGSWLSTTVHDYADSRRFRVTNNATAGATYEYRLFDSAGVLLKTRTGIVGQANSTNEVYTHTHTTNINNRITADASFVHTKEVDSTASSGQINYIRQLQYAIASGATQQNIIHRQQSFNAFGEIISETDGNNNTSDIVYDKLGNVIRRISPEVDVWTQDAFRTNTAERVRPTEHFYYNAQSELVGTQDANSSLDSGGAITGGWNNTRILNNGRVETEFFADGGIKHYDYDRLGNLRQTINQVGLATRYEYDDKGQVTRVERYNRDDQLHSYDDYHYDAIGNRIQHENALGNTESYRYDAEGRIIWHNSFAGRTTNYEYNYLANLSNNIFSDQDSEGGVDTAVGGFEKITTNAIGDTLIDRHTVFNRIVYHEDLGGHQFNYYYNNAGWLQNQTGATIGDSDRTQDQQISYEYYNNGYLKAVNDNANQRYSSFQYDRNGNRVNEYYAEVPFSIGDQARVPYQTATAEYDALNRVTNVSESDRYDISFKYDAVGNRRQVYSEYYDILRSPDEPPAVQDFYYAYDNMNRFNVTMGQLNASTGEVIRGETGYTIGYNALGQRTSAISELRNAQGGNAYRHEIYEYDPNGALTNFYLDLTEDNETKATLRSSRDNDALGQMENYFEYASNGATTLHQYYEYDEDGLVMVDQTIADGNFRDTTRYTYRADGTLTSTHNHVLRHINTVQPTSSITLTGQAATNLYYANGDLAYAEGAAVPVNDRASLYLVDRERATARSTFTYEAWDSYKKSTETINANAKGVRRWAPGTSSYSYDSNGHTRAFYDHRDDRQLEYVTNYRGQTLKRYQSDRQDNGTLADPVIRRFFYLNGIGVGDVGTDEIQSRVDYAQILADRKLIDGKGKDKGAAHGDIGDRVSVVTSADFDQNFQPIGPDYPPHSPGSYTVSSGDSLQSIAQNVWGDAALWYLIADANGLTADSPLAEGMNLTLPNTITNVHNNADTFRPYDPVATLGDVSTTLPDPVMKKDWGQIIRMIVVIIIAIIVAIYATEALETWWGVGSAWAAAGGAAIGSIASQSASVAFGLQDSIDWRQVAISAVTAGLTSGASGNGAPQTTGQAIISGAIKGIVSNSISQAVNIANNRQDEFDWRGVAVAGIAGGINGGINGPTANTTNNAKTNLGDYKGINWEVAAQGFGASLQSSLISNSVERIVRGQKEYKEYGGFDAVSVLGNAIGNALGAGISAYAQDSANARRDDKIASQYDQMIFDRHNNVGDAEAALPRVQAYPAGPREVVRSSLNSSNSNITVGGSKGSLAKQQSDNAARVDQVGLSGIDFDAAGALNDTLTPNFMQRMMDQSLIEKYIGAETSGTPVIFEDYESSRLDQLFPERLIKNDDKNWLVDYLDDNAAFDIKSLPSLSDNPFGFISTGIANVGRAGGNVLSIGLNGIADVSEALKIPSYFGGGIGALASYTDDFAMMGSSLLRGVSKVPDNVNSQSAAKLSSTWQGENPYWGVDTLVDTGLAKGDKVVQLTYRKDGVPTSSYFTTVESLQKAQIGGGLVDANILNQGLQTFPGGRSDFKLYAQVFKVGEDIPLNGAARGTTNANPYFNPSQVETLEQIFILDDFKSSLKPTNLINLSNTKTPTYLPNDQLTNNMLRLDTH